MSFLSQSDAIGLAQKFEALGYLAEDFSPLGHPERLLVLAAMAGSRDDGLCACAIAGRTGVGEAVRFHLAFLARAGLVRARRRDGWKSYSLATDAVADLVEALRV